MVTDCLLPRDGLGRISFENPKLPQLCKEKQRGKSVVFCPGLGRCSAEEVPRQGQVVLAGWGGDCDRLRPSGPFICFLPQSLPVSKVTPQRAAGCLFYQPTKGRLTRKCTRERLLIHLIKRSTSKGELCQPPQSHRHQS